MPKKLLLFADAQSIHTQRWANAMYNRGMRVEIISRYYADLHNIPVHPLQSDTYGNKKSTLLLLWNICKIPFWVRKINPDIVNPHFLTSYGILGGFSNFRPLHLTAWGSDILQIPYKKPYMRYILKILFKKAKSYNSGSQPVMDGILKTCVNKQSIKKGYVLKWGINTDVFTPVHRNTQGVFTIFSNRLWKPLYNIDIIIKAYGIFRKKYTCDSCLKIAGYGNEIHTYKDIASDGVKIIGNIKTEHHMAHALHTSHIYISIPDTDSEGVSVSEALATDIPTIVSDIPGNQKFKVLKTKIDAEILAQHMLDMANNYDTYVKKHTAIGAHIRKNESHTILMDKAFAILNKI